MPATRRIALFQAPFCFLRHGETDSNRLRITAGATDVTLNETGWRQARDAAAALAGRGIDAVFCSPLRRARDTAELVAAALGLPVAVIDQLAERNWGEFEGRPRHLRTREAKPAGGEGPHEFAQRTLAGLAQIPASQLPLVVAHSGTFRVLCQVLGMAAAQTPVANASPVRLTPGAAPGAAWQCEQIDPPTASTCDIIP